MDQDSIATMEYTNTKIKWSSDNELPKTDEMVCYEVDDK